MQFHLATLIPFFALSLAAPVPFSNTELNEILLAIENSLPIIDGSIVDVAGLITDTETTLATLTGTSTTQNGLSGACKELTVIFARGTADPGNVGFLTGPAWFDAISNIIGSDNLAVQGVDYNASVDNFLAGGDPAGGPLMVSLIEQAFSQCPDTKVVIGGYSQGGQIVHNAAALLPSDTASQVSAAVIFGDPDDGEAVTGISSNKTLIICHDGDEICAHTDLILLPHLTYAENANQAATFAVSAAGL